MKIVKKTMITLLLTIIVLTGCNKQTAKSVDIITLQDNMLAAGKKFPKMIKVSSKSENASERFSALSDIEYNKVKNFFLAHAEGGRADELAVIEVTNKKEVKEALEALRKHVEKKVKLYTSEQPKEVQKAQNSMVFGRGNYAVLIASDDNMKVKAAFEKAVEEK